MQPVKVKIAIENHSQYRGFVNAKTGSCVHFHEVWGFGLNPSSETERLSVQLSCSFTTNQSRWTVSCVSKMPLRVRWHYSINEES